MSKRIIVSVYIFGVNMNCEFSVPSDMSVGNVSQLMIRLASEEYFGESKDFDSRGSLMRISDGKLLNDTLSLSQMGISNGEKLILM